MWIHLLTLELIYGASSVAVATPGVGPGGRRPFRRNSKVIRYSDFETREAYEQALLAAIPMSEVKPYPTIERTLADEEETEEIFLLLQVMNRLH